MMTSSGLFWGDSKAMEDKTNGLFGGLATIQSCGTEVHFNTPVTDGTINTLIGQINRIIVDANKKSSDLYTSDEPTTVDVKLFISSPGGYLDPLFRFVDYINCIRKDGKLGKLVTIITGCSASAATLMAMIGDERYITEYATAMIHELSSGMQGQYTHLKSYGKHLESVHEKIIDIYCNNMKNPDRENVERFLLNETWFTSGEYLDAGFVDGIYGKVEDEENDDDEEEEEGAEPEVKSRKVPKGIVLPILLTGNQRTAEKKRKLNKHNVHTNKRVKVSTA
jgi:ATP-dependent protease ClpP protease subunit